MKFQISEVTLRILSERKVNDNFPKNFVNYLCTLVILSPQHLGNRGLDFPLESYPIIGLFSTPNSVMGIWLRSCLLGDWFSLVSRTGSVMIM